MIQVREAVQKMGKGALVEGNGGLVEVVSHMVSCSLHSNPPRPHGPSLQRGVALREQRVQDKPRGRVPGYIAQRKGRQERLPREGHRQLVQRVQESIGALLSQTDARLATEIANIKKLHSKDVDFCAWASTAPRLSVPPTASVTAFTASVILSLTFYHRLIYSPSHTVAVIQHCRTHKQRGIINYRRR